MVRRHRRRRVRPLGRRAVRGRPTTEPALPGVEDGYSAGLEIGRSVVAAGASTDDGTRIWVRRGDGAAAGGLRATPRTPASAALSEDETLLAIGHSEHGDSRHPAVRVVRVADGEHGRREVRRPRQGPHPARLRPRARRPPAAAAARAPRPRGAADLGRRRRHRDRDLTLDLPGEVAADWSPDAAFLLVWHTHAARTRLYRYDLDGDAQRAAGGAGLRRLGRRCGRTAPSSTPARRPPSRRASARCTRTAPTACSSRRPASARRARCRSRTSGDGRATSTRWSRGQATAARPTVFSLHGGPHAADEDRFSPARAAWVDAGFTVVEVNYRGSTGYGSAWRDAIEGRPGLTELEDVAAVLDHCVAEGIADPARCVVEGWSWGGYLALLAVGTQPERWAAGIAGVPVADYLAAYVDEMEQLRAFDRALFGGLAGGDAGGLPGGVAAHLRRRRCARRCSCWPGRTTRAARSGRSTTTSTRWPPAGRRLRGEPVRRGPRQPGGASSRWPTWPPRSPSPAAGCADAHRWGLTHTSRTVRQPHPACASAPPPHRYARLVVLWRVHVELEDRPGRLGELATAVGRAGCNIISLHVVGEPADDGSVTDELLVRVPSASDPAALVDEIGRAGIPCTLLVRADAVELADPATTALALARMVVAEPGSAPSAVATMLRARLVDPAAESAPGSRPHAADRRRRRCGWGGRGRSPRRSCRGPPRCWSWPPSSRCGCPPSPADGQTLLLRDGSEVRVRAAAPRTPCWWARCTRAAHRRPAALAVPVADPAPRRRASWTRCWGATPLLALTADGGSAVAVANLDAGRTAGRGPVRGARRQRLAGPRAGHGPGAAARRRRGRAGPRRADGPARPDDLGVARLLRRAGLRPAAELTDGVVHLRAELPAARARKSGS